jgi:hypothetical protein
VRRRLEPVCCALLVGMLCLAQGLAVAGAGAMVHGRGSMQYTAQAAAMQLEWQIQDWAAYSDSLV